jgi:Holliday junction resolvase
VVERLRQLGASVARVSGEDTPDLLVGWRGRTYLAEVKTGKAKLKPGQAEFARTWRGSPVATLRTPQEATDWLLGLAHPPVVDRVLDGDEVAAIWRSRHGI